MKKFILLAIVFWNLENFFDYFDGGYSDSDKSFSSFGDRHWTKKKFNAKCFAVSKAIFFISEEGNLPEILAFAEIENRFVLKRLSESTLLKKYDYKIVHYESPDPRGIDVGLLYRNLTLLESQPVRIEGLTTRDILFCGFRTPEGDSLAVLINHHPSKYSGASSEAKRVKAMETLKSVTDSLRSRGWIRQVALGDFNDTPKEGPLDESFYNLSLPLSKEGRGTIRYNGVWQLIDQAFVSKGLGARMEIKEIPFLMVPDSSFPGMKPLRTYSGPRYLGGVSDHLPIIVFFP